MRFLIVAVAIFASAAAAPSALLAGHLGLAAAPLAYAAPLAVNHGDLQAAAIDAHVDASDHARAAVDAVGQLNDQVAENHGKAVNAAEELAWSSVNAAQTAVAGLDGAAAGASPIVAKQLAGHGAVAAYAAPALAAYSARALVAAPAISAYSAPLLGAPLGYAAHGLAAHGLGAHGLAAHGLAHAW